MTSSILIPMLVGVICAFLGFFLGKRRGKKSHDKYEDRIRRLENSLEDSKKAKAKLDLILKSAKFSNIDVSASLSKPIPKIAPFDAFRAKSFLGKSVKENDLTLIEGIGPKVQELFHNHYINTWKALSECSVDQCQKILNSGGERFTVHNPGTWAEQARLAHEGEWKELLKWQNQLVEEK